MTGKKTAKETKPSTVVANDPDDLKGRLKNIGGSRSDHWNNILANQTVQALWLKHSDPATRDKQYSAAVAALVGIGPKDELEGMMAAQLIAAHNAAMECYRRAMLGEQTFEGREQNLRDWQAYFDERAGIARFHGGLPRGQAKHRAFDCCLVEWLNRNPASSSAGRCLGCAQAEQAHDPLLPFGIESSGHAWLHSRCWPAWHTERRAEAIAALAAMGIDQPRTHR